jgi:hypothetical protein
MADNDEYTIQNEIGEAVQFDEIETKMVKAQLYFELLGLDLFEDIEPELVPIADVVRAEFQTFVRQQIDALMSKPRKGKALKATPTKAPKSPLVALMKRKSRKTNDTPAPRPVGQAKTEGRSPSVAAAVQSADDIEMTDEYTTIETPYKDGNGVMTKVYRKVIDRKTQKEIYLGFDMSDEGELVPDGNKYIMYTEGDKPIFRTITTQFVPKERAPLNKAAFEAEMAQHAAQTINTVKKAMGTSIIAQISNQVEKG